MTPSLAPIERIEAQRAPRPSSAMVLRYRWRQRSHMMRIEKRSPSINAVSMEARPGAITGMSSSERAAARPESLMVSMHTAS